MRISALLFVLFLAGSAFAQTINADSLDTREGIAYPKGSTVAFTGTAVAMNEMGTKASTVEYKDGMPDGILLSWYPNGTKQVEGELHGKVHVGVWKAWYESGQLKRQGAFKDGKEEGTFTWYFEDGKKSKEGSYREGVEDGMWSWYHDNGRLMQQGVLKGDTSEGVWKEWYPDGKPKMVGTFVNGEKHGEWTWWDAKGNKSTKAYSAGSITQASDSSDLFVERTREMMGKRDLNASLESIQEAIDLVDDRTEDNPEYMWLVILKGRVYEQFQHLEEA
ncbi:MAG: toxin-antitoxin system YwqK family antitoxin, partial [Flavobacteriales bacterium]